MKIRELTFNTRLPIFIIARTPSISSPLVSSGLNGRELIDGFKWELNNHMLELFDNFEISHIDIRESQIDLYFEYDDEVLHIYNYMKEQLGKDDGLIECIVKEDVDNNKVNWVPATKEQYEECYSMIKNKYDGLMRRLS